MKPLRKLGSDGPPVGAVGYGAMGLEGYYGSTDEDSAVNVIRHALDEGCSMIDTADAYGNGHNEELVGRAVADRRDKAVIATKFGIVFDPVQTGTDVPQLYAENGKAAQKSYLSQITTLCHFIS